MNIFKTIEDWIDADGIDTITRRNVILGNPKFGKSTYGRLCLQIYTKKKFPLTYIDPGGIAASIRCTQDDVVIIGGEYGDVELDQVDKVLPALMDKEVNFIIDTFELDDEFNKEVIGDLFEFFFNWHREYRRVRKYIIDECDYYVPQYHFDRTCKANIIRCVSKARMFGMGFDFITQNFTMIDKTVLKMVDNHLIFNMSDPIDLKRIGELLGERIDSKIKHLAVGRCLIYNKKDKYTYTVNEPESPSAGSTPRLHVAVEKLDLLELNPRLQELIK